MNSFIIHRENQEYGPYTLESLKTFLESGNVSESDYVRATDSVKWTTVGAVFAAPPPPVAKAKNLAPESQVAQGCKPASGNRTFIIWCLGILATICALSVLYSPTVYEKFSERIKEERQNGVVYIGPGSKRWNEDHPTATASDDGSNADGFKVDAADNVVGFSDIKSLQDFISDSLQAARAVDYPYSQILNGDGVQQNSDNPQVQGVIRGMNAEMSKADSSAIGDVLEKFFSAGKAIRLRPGNFKVAGYYDKNGNEIYLKDAGAPGTDHGPWYVGIYYYDNQEHYVIFPSN